MIPVNYRYVPDYSVPPGWLIEEILESRGWHQAELVRRCNLSAKTISEIIQGKAPISSNTAIELERILGISATVWVNMESLYRLREAQNTERKDSKKQVDWVKRFPIQELIKGNWIKNFDSPNAMVNELLAFFGVGSIAAWEECYGNLPVHYRDSQAFSSSLEDIVSWLRIGELKAAKEKCARYDKHTFHRVLHDIRKMTISDPEIFYSQMKDRCAQAGVVVLGIPPFGKNRLSGAAYWLNTHKAVIQLSLRYKTNDHFWFTFFHEAAHILQHGKKETFVDEEKQAENSLEKEADLVASDFLIPHEKWIRFSRQTRFTTEIVKRFAEEIGIAPGIVVGRLQHEGKIGYNQLNSLKIRFQWIEENAEN